MIFKFLYFGQSGEYYYFAETKPVNFGDAYWTSFYTLPIQAASQSELLGTLAVSEIQYNSIYERLVAYPTLVGALALRNQNHFSDGLFNGVLNELNEWLYDVSHHRRIGAIEVDV